MNSRERKKVKVFERRVQFLGRRIPEAEAESGAVFLPARRELAAVESAIALFGAASDARERLSAALRMDMSPAARNEVVEALRELRRYQDRERAEVRTWDTSIDLTRAEAAA